jgi:hypothetical protein
MSHDIIDSITVDSDDIDRAHKGEEVVLREFEHVIYDCPPKWGKYIVILKRKD